MPRGHSSSLSQGGAQNRFLRIPRGSEVHVKPVGQSTASTQSLHRGIQSPSIHALEVSQSPQTAPHPSSPQDFPSQSGIQIGLHIPLSQNSVSRHCSQGSPASTSELSSAETNVSTGEGRTVSESFPSFSFSSLVSVVAISTSGLSMRLSLASSPTHATMLRSNSVLK